MSKEMGERAKDLSAEERILRARARGRELSRLQGVKRPASFDELLGHFWPDDEPVDEFNRTIRSWRDESPAKEFE